MRKKKRPVQTKDVLIMLAITVLMLVIYLVALYTAKSNTDRAEEYGVEVRALVVSERSTGHRRRNKEYTVSYQDNKGYSYKRTLPLATGGFNKGDEITIIVNHNNYDEILVSGGEKRLILIFRLALASTFILTIVLSIIVRNKSKCK